MIRVKHVSETHRHNKANKRRRKKNKGRNQEHIMSYIKANSCLFRTRTMGNMEARVHDDVICCIVGPKNNRELGMIDPPSSPIYLRLDRCKPRVA